MKPEIMNNHAALSETAEEFVHYAIEENRCLKSFELLSADLPKMLREYEYPINSWPCFISPETKQSLEECVTQTSKLIYKALKLEFKQRPKQLAEFYKIPEILASLFLDGDISMVESTQRIDGIWTDKGLKVMEVNVGSTIGGWQIQFVEEQYRHQKELAPFFEKHKCYSRNIPQLYFEFLVTKVMSHPQFSGEVNLLMVADDWFFENEGEDAIKVFFDAALRKNGVDGKLIVDHCYDKVTFQVDGVYHEQNKLGAVISTHFINETIKIPQDLYRAYLGNQIYWPDNPYCLIIGDKRSLSILYKYKDHPEFTEHEQQCIRTYIPWASVIEQKEVEYKGQHYPLSELLINKKDEFVIKIGQGLKGDDVYVGKFQTQDTWEAVVDKAITDNSGWLAQVYCESLEYYGQKENSYSTYDVVWGIFGYGSEYGGCWLRLMGKECSDGVINSARGAQETIVFEVEK